MEIQCDAVHGDEATTEETNWNAKNEHKNLEKKMYFYSLMHIIVVFLPCEKYSEWGMKEFVFAASVRLE